MNHPINSQALLTIREGLLSTLPTPDDHVEYTKEITLEPINALSIPSGKLTPLEADILREDLAAFLPNVRDILAANLLAESTGREVTLEEWCEWQDRNEWPEGHVGQISGGRRVSVYNAARGYGVKLIGKSGKPSRYFVNTFTNPMVKG